MTFNNTKGHKTPYVGAGPEADKAWEHITMHSKWALGIHLKRKTQITFTPRAKHLHLPIKLAPVGLTVGKVGDQMLTEADMAALGKPHDRLRVTDNATGETGWRMELAVVHQLHCLNLFRKFVHRKHYEPLGGDLAVPEERLTRHLGES